MSSCFKSELLKAALCISIPVSFLTVVLMSCSNPAVQVKAVEGGALQTLLTMLATTQPLRVKKKVLTHTRVTIRLSIECTHTVLMFSTCGCVPVRFCLQWPPYYVTSPTHSFTSCHMEGCRFYQSCSCRTEAGFCAHASSPCYMT